MNIILIISALIIAIAIWTAIEHYRMKKLATKRGNANICEYARSFDFRNVDTKIMREVWNELQLYLGKYNGKPFPIKAEDTFEQNYKIDSDDLDDIYWSVADRLNISTEQPENNPYFDKVTNVRNLVLFLNNQPRRSNT